MQAVRIHAFGIFSSHLVVLLSVTLCSQFKQKNYLQVARTS
jgi:hypothetical protein